MNEIDSEFLCEFLEYYKLKYCDGVYETTWLEAAAIAFRLDNVVIYIRNGYIYADIGFFAYRKVKDVAMADPECFEIIAKFIPNTIRAANPSPAAPRVV